MRFLQFSWLFLILLISILFYAHNSLVHGQCLNDQRDLLLQLNQTLVFSPSASFATSLKISNWSSNTDCCTAWEGVICDRAGHVISLDLSEEYISGRLDNSSSLFKFLYLERLNLAFNTFSSIPIPSGFDRLANLTYLNLSNSGFNGQIPIELSRMTRLVTLDLSSFLPGRAPLILSDPDFGMLIRNLKELRELWLDGVNISAEGTKWCKDLSSSLPNLQVLSLSNCYLTGPFDDSLLQLRSLYELRLDLNNISAEVPEFFGGFANLTSLRLSTCGLKGKFPEKIFQIQTLRTVYLSGNKLLYGSLPEFPKDGLLETMVLSDTNFSGELPKSIGNLRHLSRLELENCSFKGSIPDSIENLKQLLYLDLSMNSFNGLIPSTPWSESLIKIDLSGNRLRGSVPSHWNNLTKLNNLNLKNNSLNGTIPPTLFALPSLQKLDLSQNQFSGQLGEFHNVFSSPLDTLDLSINMLEGPIPKSLFNLTNLIILALSSNKFNGTENLDMFFQKFRNLSSLDLSGNNLSINARDANFASFPQVGTLKLRSCNLKVFPNFLTKQSKLNYLDLSDNKIQGKIPNWIFRIGNGTLTHLNLSYNLLEDPDQPFPDKSFNWLGVLDLSSNMLQGKNLILPSSASVLDYSKNNFTSIIPIIGSYLSVAIFLSFSSNQLKGQIPISICDASFIQVLDVSNNSLSGRIPPCLGEIGSLRVLNLRGNDFHGAMPDTFPGNCSLRTFDLNGNKLDGQVAKSLANCAKLEVLDLGNNQIDGAFPSWLANMSRLRVLVLRSNKFYGPLGNSGTDHNFPKLQIIDISSNKFNGSLSNKCFSSWTAMMEEKEGQSNQTRKILRFGFLELTRLYYQDTVTVTSKGLEMELVKILKVFTCIDISNNEFEGQIPEMIGSLKSLYILNFSSNAFTGPIPWTIGNLTQIESLDLSWNKLSGEIPTQLASLSFLAVLNLSFNNLVGMIPTGQQLQTFTETSFEGNEGLCGPPLAKNCSNIPVSPLADSNDEGGVDWKFIVTGLGFGAGVGMVIAPLLFWKKGRQWFNEYTNRIILMILPEGMLHINCDDGKVDSQESFEEELTEMTGDYDNRDEETEEGFKGHYCVFCTKLDMSRKMAIHNPNCKCHTWPPISSFVDPDY